MAIACVIAGTALAGACQTDELEVETFEAVLSGSSEVPPRDTPAKGSAEFQAIGGTVSWTLTVSGISNVTAAHIHGPAPTSQNAGVVVTLLPSGPLTGTRTGSFAEVDEGSSVTTMEALLQLMRSGQAYVNVHTSDGAEPPDTGPGDFPGGEIRGQIQPL
jgi:hypothetical protein